jgi:uncharacterized coiled-coil protein SlyX
MSTAERHVSLPKPFASGDANEWFKKFDLCCKANRWDAAAQALKLPTLLEGEALAIWLELSEDEQATYATAKEKVVKGMMPMGFVSMDEFHRRKLRPGEALSVFLHDLKKLLGQAMPDLDKAAHDPLLVHQFLAGLPDVVSRQIRASAETSTLDAVVTRARLLMSIDDHNQVAIVAKEADVEKLQEQVALLTEQVATLSTANQAQPKFRSQPRCFKCNQVGHLQHECTTYPRYRGPELRRCFQCGQQGHLARYCRTRYEQNDARYERTQGNDAGMPVRGGRYPFRK